MVGQIVLLLIGLILVAFNARMLSSIFSDVEFRRLSALEERILADWQSLLDNCGEIPDESTIRQHEEYERKSQIVLKALDLCVHDYSILWRAFTGRKRKYIDEAYAALYGKNEGG